MSPQLAEALRSEIRTALEADGKPFDVNVARRVYDLAIAARDMCVAATSGVKEAIDQLKETNGPMESLDAPDAPESQLQASETFGARIIREVLALIPTLQQRNEDSAPLVQVHAIAAARRSGMYDVAEALEIKLLGRVLPGDKPIADSATVHVLPDPVVADPPLCESCKTDPDPRGASACFTCREIARTNRQANANPLDEEDAMKKKPHAFEARTTDPTHQACAHCDKAPRNKIHTNRELFEMPEYSSNGVTL